MKSVLASAFILGSALSGLNAQAINTTVCEVMKNPKAFDGQTVTIKGRVAAGFDQFLIRDGDCGTAINGIWLAYPQGTKAKAGPAVMVELAPAHNFAGEAAPIRTPVKLNKDKSFKLFDTALGQVAAVPGICLGCVQNEVQATVTGRLDGVESAAIKGDGSGKIVSLGGFGNMNAYPARLVISSVSDVTPEPVMGRPPDQQPAQGRPMSGVAGLNPQDNGSMVAINNIASGVAPNGNGQPPPAQAEPVGPDNYPDQLASLQKVSSAMAPMPITIQIQKDVALLPKPKEHSPVTIGNGAMDEVAANEGATAASDSPDGVVYNCTINHDKLSGISAMLTLIHIAQHIEDVRSAAANNRQAPLFELENNAWVASATMAATGGIKRLTLPGGYLIWNAAWPDADKNANLQTTLNRFLNREEGMN